MFVKKAHLIKVDYNFYWACWTEALTTPVHHNQAWQGPVTFTICWLFTALQYYSDNHIHQGGSREGSHFDMPLCTYAKAPALLHYSTTVQWCCPCQGLYQSSNDLHSLLHSDGRIWWIVLFCCSSQEINTQSADSTELFKVCMCCCILCARCPLWTAWSHSACVYGD